MTGSAARPEGRTGPSLDSERDVADLEILFEPVPIGSLRLRNRFVMSPMTRNFSPGGVPGDDVAAYYRRRAGAGFGFRIWVARRRSSAGRALHS